jgi:hypothetical protein
MALFTAASFALYLVGIPAAAVVAPALGVAATGIGAGLCALRRMRRDDSPIDRGSPAMIVAGLGIALEQLVVTIWVAVHSLLRHDDAWTVWAFKARLFALGGPPAGYFQHHDWSSHPDYPLNLPLAEAVFFRFPDPLGLTLAALVSTACLAALLLLFYAGLARLYGRTVAALAAGALMAVPSLPRFAGYGYADVPLALYAGAAALYLLLWWRGRRPVDLVLMGLLAGGAIWTKKEGLPLALLELFAFCVGQGLRHDASRAKRLSHIAWAGLATVALPLPWLIFTLTVRPVGSDFLPITVSVFVANVNRLPQTFLLFLQETVIIARWSLFWVIVAAAVALTVRRLSLRGRALLALLLAQLAMYLGSYVFSDWVPYTLHVDSSLNRLMIQAVPLALLVMVEAVQPCPLPAPERFKRIGGVAGVSRQAAP